jgi:FkbH-like protein
LSRKLLVWDLDNTIWDGIYLYDREKVQLKKGIVEIVKELDNRGILQSVISKTVPQAQTLLERFGLWDYFVFPQLNFNFKPLNMEIILKYIPFSPKHVAYIDDDPTERQLMSMKYPEILCLDAKDYDRLLDHPEFEVKEITKEGKERRLFYKAEEKRLSLADVDSEEFLERLGMEVEFHPAKDTELGRVLELYQRTHRMNATGEPYTIQKVREWHTDPEKKIIVGYAWDKFGSYGTVAVAFVAGDKVEGMAVSCRALGRGILSALLSVLSKDKTIKIKVKETEFNKVFRDELEKAGCVNLNDGYWVGKDVAPPRWVKIHVL